METFVATFFSHYGAVKYRRELKAAGIDGQMMPVPRKVSSSCGTCVCFCASGLPDIACRDVEAYYRKCGAEYERLQTNL